MPSTTLHGSGQVSGGIEQQLPPGAAPPVKLYSTASLLVYRGEVLAAMAP